MIRTPATSETSYAEPGARKRIGTLPLTAFAVTVTVKVTNPDASVVPLAGLTVTFAIPVSLFGSSGCTTTPDLAVPSNPVTFTVIAVESRGGGISRLSTSFVAWTSVISQFGTLSFSTKMTNDWN